MCMRAMAGGGSSYDVASRGGKGDGPAHLLGELLALHIHKDASDWGVLDGI